MTHQIAVSISIVNSKLQRQNPKVVDKFHEYLLKFEIKDLTFDKIATKNVMRLQIIARDRWMLQHSNSKIFAIKQNGINTKLNFQKLFINRKDEPGNFINVSVSKARGKKN